MQTPPEDPNVIVVPCQPGKSHKGLLAAIAILMIATVGLVVRGTVNDWRGLSQELEHRLSRFFPKSAKPDPTLIAKAHTQAPEAAPTKPSTTAQQAKEPAADPNADPASSKSKVAPADPSPWDDIKKSAEKAKAEREEAERLKEQAAKELDQKPLPPARPGFRGRPMNPADLAAIQREMMERMDMLMQRDPAFQRMDELRRRMRAEAFGIQPRELRGRTPADEMQRLMDEFANDFFNQAPGFGNFRQQAPRANRQNVPQRGMNRLNPPQPGQPRIHEESGEEEQNGVKTKWRTRVIIIGGR